MSQAAEVFELALPVEPADIDELGHVNNVAYLRWVQEAAVAHWTAAAPAADQAKLRWVVVRHEIDYLRPAFLGDGIIARTWVGAASRLRFERFTELVRAADRSVLVKARTEWCPIDSQTGKPVSVSAGVRARFSVPALLLAALLCLAATMAAHAQPKTGEWQPLFDGKSLQGWRETPFTGRGEVRISNGRIVLGAGSPMTGITWTGPFPRTDYEVRLEGARLQGSDFFASLTFPVEDSYATWVTGGWGGDIVGLSSIDGWDASDNETRSYFNFENGRWYALRIQVTEERIRAWIDDKPVIDVLIGGRSIGLRPGEIELSAPLGFASYHTAGALRKAEYRLLRPR
jgi:YbgC/YbaW family acyl-CoA thioester hydrolase